MLNVQFSKSQLDRINRLFRDMPKFIPRIMRDSLNKTAVTVRSWSIKRLAARTGLLQKQVRSFTFIDRATLRYFAAKIRFSAHKIPFGWFKPKPSGSGLLASRSGEFQHGGFLIESSRVKASLAFRREGRARKPLEFIRSGNTLADYYLLIRSIVEEGGSKLLQHHIDVQIKRFLEKL